MEKRIYESIMGNIKIYIFLILRSIFSDINNLAIQMYSNAPVMGVSVTTIGHEAY